VETGRIEAMSREAAAALLTARGLFPLDLRLVESERGARHRLPAADLAVGLRVLASLLEAGLPLAKALGALGELVPASWHPGLPAITAAVREGRTLAAALRDSALQVPAVVLGIVEAGEAGSGLARAVRRAADLAEQTAATRSALRQALAYPALLSCAGLASVGLLVGVVLPRFAAILADLGQALPPATRLVLAAAAHARAGAVPALMIVALGIVLWRLWTATDAGRAAWHAWLLGLPLVGRIRHAAATARTGAALAALLESGVPIAPALHHAGRAAGDWAVASRLVVTRERVVTGERLSTALGATGAMTPTAVRLARAGEETGELATMIARAAVMEHERAAQGVRGLVRLLEPALIIVFGGLVAVVAAALLQAIYGVRPGA
jgi:general secretion pathway protein F